MREWRSLLVVLGLLLSGLLVAVFVAFNIGMLLVTGAEVVESMSPPDSPMVSMFIDKVDANKVSLVVSPEVATSYGVDSITIIKDENVYAVDMESVGGEFWQGELDLGIEICFADGECQTIEFDGYYYPLPGDDEGSFPLVSVKSGAEVSYHVINSDGTEITAVHEDSLEVRFSKGAQIRIFLPK